MSVHPYPGLRSFLSGDDLAPDSEHPSAAPGAGDADSGDLALLRRMAAGDTEALGTLYDRWSQRVHSLAARLLQDADDAEDVVAETFWRAWRSVAGYQPSRGSVGGWLLAIARSRALDRARTRHRRAGLREAALAGSPLGESASAIANPLRYTEEAERRRRILQVLAELPPEQRQALELAYFRGMSHSEIAAHTCHPLGTVKTRIRLALRKLRSHPVFLDERDRTPAS